MSAPAREASRQHQPLLRKTEERPNVKGAEQGDRPRKDGPGTQAGQGYVYLKPWGRTYGDGAKCAFVTLRRRQRARERQRTARKGTP